MPAIPAKGVVYLLHFHEPLHHAKHYLGSSLDLIERLTDHANGDGARLTEVLLELGMHWELAAIYVPTKWSNLSIRQHEALCKRRKNAADFCPICCDGLNEAPSGMEEYPLPKNLTTHFLRK